MTIPPSNLLSSEIPYLCRSYQYITGLTSNIDSWRNLWLDKERPNGLLAKAPLGTRREKFWRKNFTLGVANLGNRLWGLINNYDDLSGGNCIEKICLSRITTGCVYRTFKRWFGMKIALLNNLTKGLICSIWFNSKCLSFIYLG